MQKVSEQQKSVRPAWSCAFLFAKKRGYMKENQSVLGKTKISSLIWKLGLPMIISMVLQAIYNVVDTVFVVNMGEGGIEGNLALTYAFPVQILIIAIGVGTGVGINVLLSRSLG